MIDDQLQSVYIPKAYKDATAWTKPLCIHFDSDDNSSSCSDGEEYGEEPGNSDNQVCPGDQRPRSDVAIMKNSTHLHEHAVGRFSVEVDQNKKESNLSEAAQIRDIAVKQVIQEEPVEEVKEVGLAAEISDKSEEEDNHGRNV